ncbi:hypothetical protein GCM10007298_05800 [Williamsia phyllosphaerae]|uniref:Uncharacterized protein n=1 Tax=Williamsia phyllosphaerae TaxID=885042 RepID=A0ABQ1UC67_9NOCA|nr:hypothetical protein GCM10007298_05800 [Williamsia phyllosphaerae]
MAGADVETPVADEVASDVVVGLLAPVAVSIGATVPAPVVDPQRCDLDHWPGACDDDMRPASRAFL